MGKILIKNKRRDMKGMDDLCQPDEEHNDVGKVEPMPVSKVGDMIMKNETDKSSWPRS